MPVTLEPGETKQLNVALEPIIELATIYGYITDSETGEPVPLVRPEIKELDFVGELSDGSGIYRIDNVPYPKGQSIVYTVKFTPTWEYPNPQYKSAEYSVTVDRTSVRVDVELECTWKPPIEPPEPPPYEEQYILGHIEGVSLYYDGAWIPWCDGLVLDINKFEIESQTGPRKRKVPIRVSCVNESGFPILAQVKSVLAGPDVPYGGGWLTSGGSIQTPINWQLENRPETNMMDESKVFSVEQPWVAPVAGDFTFSVVLSEFKFGKTLDSLSYKFTAIA
jgi:hypothetical protein